MKILLMRPKLAQRFETFMAGVFYIAIGIILATEVNAQSKAPVTPMTKVSTAAPKSPAPSAAKPARAACETNQAPDAMCTLPIQQGPESKICFSIKHARCFELKGKHLIQTLNGSVSADATLNDQQEAAVKTSIQTYQTWLDMELSKKGTSVSLCRDVATIDSKSEHKEFCLSKLAHKDVQAKTRELFFTLENPTATTSSVAPTSKTK